MTSMSDAIAIPRRELLFTATALAAAPLAGQASGKVKVGVVGCGSVAGAYLSRMAESPHIEVVSACDIIPERAEQRAQRFRIPNVFPDVGQMLKGPSFDLMVNLTSMPAHFPVSMAGLQAGKSVWSEKPLSTTTADARKLLAFAREKKLGLWCAPITILSPQFKFMNETLRSGKLGKVTAAHAHYGHEGKLWSAWFFQKGGGSLFDLGVYNITSLTGLLGPAKSVVGMMSICEKKRELTDKTVVEVEAPDNEMLIMDHGNGVFSHVQSGYNYGSADGHAGKTDQYTIDFWGTEGDMHLCGYDWGPHGVDVATLKEPRKRYAEDPAGYRWANGVNHIAECMVSGKPALVTAEHAYHVLEIMEACFESNRTGRRITIQSTFPWPVAG
jgi:predicted dehydrogenase